MGLRKTGKKILILDIIELIIFVIGAVIIAVYFQDNPIIFIIVEVLFIIILISVFKKINNKL